MYFIEMPKMFFVFEFQGIKAFSMYMIAMQKIGENRSLYKVFACLIFNLIQIFLLRIYPINRRP